VQPKPASWTVLCGTLGLRDVDPFMCYDLPHTPDWKLLPGTVVLQVD
jgi:hypothetical protein